MRYFYLAKIVFAFWLNHGTAALIKKLRSRYHNRLIRSHGNLSQKMVNSKIILEYLKVETEFPNRYLTSTDLQYVVIIPVYNGLAHVLRLRASISNQDIPIILIDDASPDPMVRQFLEDWSNDKNVTLIRNEVNLGFPATVNRAIAECESDFILLNSDTQVNGDWHIRLMQRLYRNEKTAAVTPFSNSATIFSWPDGHDQQQLLPVAEIDDAARKLNVEHQLNAPSINGFCVAIKRTAWNRVGNFDSDTFKVGYGEENDWSMRARSMGYTVELAPNVFVSHVHGGSFEPKIKNERTLDAWKTLISKHPSYEVDVYEHINSDPWKEIRLAIVLRIAISRTPVVFFSHGIGGGAEVWMNDRVNEIVETGESAIVITPDSMGTVNLSISISTFQGLKNYVISGMNLDLFLDQLKNNLPKSIVLNSFVNWTKPLAILKKLSEFPIIEIPIHDFFLCCPSYNLINDSGHFCGIPDNPRNCDSCLKRNLLIPSFLGIDKIEDWRFEVESFISNKNVQICFFSYESLSWFKKAFPVNFRMKVEKPTYVKDLQQNLVRGKNLDIRSVDRFQIAFVGHIHHAKGANVVVDIVSTALKRDWPVDFHVIGELISSKRLPKEINVHGRYNRNELAEVIHSIGIDVVILPSIWPETYNIVADEVTATNTKLIVPPIGAMKERFESDPRVYVSQTLDFSGYIDLLASIIGADN